MKDKGKRIWYPQRKDKREKKNLQQRKSKTLEKKKSVKALSVGAHDTQHH